MVRVAVPTRFDAYDDATSNVHIIIASLTLSAPPFVRSSIEFIFFVVTCPTFGVCVSEIE